jgi:hypothetical protein
MGTIGATCDHFLKSEPRDIPKAEWDDFRFAQLCISSEAYADVKREIEQLCSSRPNLCDYQTKEALYAFFARMEKLK